MQLFMDVLKGLEGNNKVSVEGIMFVKDLEKTIQFTEKEVRAYIQKMFRDVSIYEATPLHYLRV